MVTSSLVRSTSPLVLIWHGSRDARASAGFESFVEATRRRIPSTLIGGCQLECAELSLSEQLGSLVGSWAVTSGRAIALPVFMGSGVHVSEDIPAAIATFRQQYPAVDIQTLPPLGHAPELAAVLCDRCMAYPEVDAWILWGHGSRLPAMAQGLASVRLQLEAQLSNCGPVDLAFWSQSPNWQEAIEALAEQGYVRIGILPCFWFAGGLIDRLAAELRAWQSRHPGLQVVVTDVLTPHPLWGEVIAEQVARAHREEIAIESVA